MSETATALEMSPPPELDAIARIGSSPQLSAFWDKQTADQAFNSRLLSGDGNAVKILRAYEERKDQLATAESLITAAQDPNVPQPAAGGANVNGVSKADQVLGVQWQLEGGASLEEVVEFEVGEAMVSPEDFRTIERTVRSRCIDNPEFMKAYLSGNPQARAIMDRWHRIATLSRPLPPIPRYGIAK